MRLRGETGIGVQADSGVDLAENQEQGYVNIPQLRYLEETAAVGLVVVE